MANGLQIRGQRIGTYFHECKRGQRVETRANACQLYFCPETTAIILAWISGVSLAERCRRINFPNGTGYVMSHPKSLYELTKQDSIVTTLAPQLNRHFS